MLVLIVLMLMLGTAMVIQNYIAKIRKTVVALMFAHAPVTGRATYVADAFLRGLGRRAVNKI